MEPDLLEDADISTDEDDTDTNDTVLDNNGEEDYTSSSNLPE
jgi:hypothetical protein